jgi:hypothetical protein
MQSFILPTLLITSLATAVPTPQPRATYHGISIGVVVSSDMEPSKIIEPSPVEINKLTPCHDDANNGCSVSQLIVQKDTANNVDENAVECRGYKDFEGLVPGSAPFSVAKPADVSTNLGTVGSFLCYVVEV